MNKPNWLFPALISAALGVTLPNANVQFARARVPPWLWHLLVVEITTSFTLHKIAASDVLSNPPDAKAQSALLGSMQSTLVRTLLDVILDAAKPDLKGETDVVAAVDAAARAIGVTPPLQRRFGPPI